MPELSYNFFADNSQTLDDIRKSIQWLLVHYFFKYVFQEVAKIFDVVKLRCNPLKEN